MCTLPERWQKKTAVGAARDYFFDVWWRQAFTALVYGGVPDRSRARRHDGDRQGARAGRRRAGRSSCSRRGRARPTGTCSGSGTGRRGWRSSSASGWCRSRSSGPTRRCRRAGGGRGKGRPVVTLRYGEALYPEEGETHQHLSGADAAGRDAAVRRGPHRLVPGDSRGPSAARPRRSRDPSARPGAARGRARGRSPRRGRPRTWK